MEKILRYVFFVSFSYLLVNVLFEGFAFMQLGSTLEVIGEPESAYAQGSKDNDPPGCTEGSGGSGSGGGDVL